MHDQKQVTRRSHTGRGVFGTIAAAVVGLARRAGSLAHHPMPELREVAHEWRRRHA
jgi:hypothetical protein